MADRLIPRRQVLAFIALHGTEATMPRVVEIREYIHERVEWHVINLTVDDEAAVRHWVAVFGHDEKHLRSWTSDLTGTVHFRSQDENGWRGFTTIIEAALDAPSVAETQLDAETIAQLREIAGEAES